MDIKVGDIVRYQGRTYRVLNRVNSSMKELQIFGSFGGTWVYEPDVTLVESIQVPTFEIGDYVVINDIPSWEKAAGNGVWVSRMNSRIGGVFKVEDYQNHNQHGPLVLLDGLWFRTYHLEKISDYDII